MHSAEAFVAQAAGELNQAELIQLITLAANMEEPDVNSCPLQRLERAQFVCVCVGSCRTKSSPESVPTGPTDLTDVGMNRC